ncbi:hypothetical protein F4859DRAFT_286342 [Xylaria cf. heliscus]|nr:hypothetical protein F4859DRAFT_286342 [Xylaria cf. heliscus]
MSSIQGLLLLPLPPQRTTYPHMHTALYPTIRATISSVLKAGGINGTSVLEIAIPLTRPSEEADTYHDVFARARPLVANIYRLVAATCADLSIPSTGPGSVDIRALFVQDEIDSSGGGKSIPFAVINYTTLAVSSREWTHVFAVESEPGEQIFRKFCAIARKHGSKRDTLFADVRRVAGGIQIYDPRLAITSVTVLETARPSNCEIVVLISGDIVDQYSDKYLLTMALFAIPQQGRGGQTFTDEGEQRLRHIRVVVSKGALHEELKTRIMNFLVTATGKVCSCSTDATQDECALQLRFITWDELETNSSGLEGSVTISDGGKELGNILHEKGASIVLQPLNGVND